MIRNNYYKSIIYFNWAMLEKFIVSNLVKNGMLNKSGL
jgi:hypothetical protein